MLNSDFTEIINLLKILIAELYPQHGPILEVVAVLIFLWLLGKLLPNTPEHMSSESVSPIATDFSPELLPELPECPQGLNIDRLAASQQQELKKFIEKKDKLRLAIFFAVHQPTILEIKSLFESVRGQQPLEHDNIINFIADSKHILNDLQSEKLRLLTKNDIYSIQVHNKKNRKLIDKDFIVKFGNLLFMENFIMYNHLCRTNPAIFHIPRDSELRRMFETFVKTGLAIQGLSIPMEIRLHILDLKQLQTIANELKIIKTLNTVHEAALTLANDPLTVVRLASKYASNDLFLLKQENWDTHAVEQEWSAYNAYAKLLCATSM
ncbi:MAG: hypothetical protein GXP19_07030 [Gammaproteobacteria bacterium]|nr:hypothetical protein [Gammaproteobacteria bacterium]